MNRVYFTCLCLITFWSSGLDAQRLETFSEDREEFIRELQEYVTSNKRKEMDEVYTDFEALYLQGVFSEEEINQIHSTANDMLVRRMSANPYFFGYLSGLVMVKKDENGDQKFRDWHMVLNNILEKTEQSKLKSFLDFTSFTADFLKNRALNFSENSTSWLTIADDYSFDFKNGQPIFSFDKLDLISFNKKDSISINGTSGDFYPVEMVWRGKGGTVEWDEFPKVDAYTELAKYEVEVRRSLYSADSATLYYPLYFGNKGIIGTFEDKLINSALQHGATYPRFGSYEKILEIDNFGEGIKYTGGFRLNGNLVYGFGTNEGKAEINIFNASDDLVFRGIGNSFTVLRGERISGEQVESTFYTLEDSLYHPSVNIRYNIEDRSLQLSRGKRGSDRNPFFSSRHGVNIEVENVNAFIDRDTVILGKKSISLAKNTDVFFESLKYYAEGEYRRVQNIATVNPIAIMKITAEEEGTNFIDANLIASRINSNFTVENIYSLIYDMSSKGFINYNSDTEIIEIKDKVFHYADASQEQADFDYIKIRSNTDEANAVFNLKDRNIHINGVSSLEFSPRQKVGLIPDSTLITLKENRNMDFDGTVFAGFTTLEGKQYKFDYEKFQIEMDSIKFFDLYVPTGELDQNNNPVALSIGSRIEDLSGILLIDAPSNKSGKDNIRMFPSFQSKDLSYVYYDKDSLFDAAYERDSFYFELKPFSFNHLDAFGPKDVNFEGTLKSSGIFPDFDETLALQEGDQSLGFVSQTPEEGYEGYGGKGNYKGEISLSNEGLEGKGTLQYLGALVDSEDIIFKPKELSASAEKFDLEENEEAEVQVPQVRGVDVKINWRPYKDSMYVRSEKESFALFKEDNHTLDGTLILTPGGLKADGLLDWDKASMDSDLFSFGTFSAYADTTDVKIKTFDAKDLALQTSDVTADVNFIDKVGYFKSNDEEGRTKLPYNAYETSMNEFDWDMGGETITFKDEEDKIGSFLSVHPEQDSLLFDGETAMYDLRSSELRIGGVPYIVAGDAFVYPDSGNVIIKPGGVMTTLQNARIVADTLNRYHVINESTVNIYGKKNYRASGFYEYNIGDKEQTIELSDINAQRVGTGPMHLRPVITKATGEVTPEDNFFIDHKTEYRGKITLSADTKDLKFDGFARLDADKLPEKYWFSIHSRGDKQDLAIEYDSPKSYEGEVLKTGLYLSKETAEIYPSVMMPLTFRKDREILSAKGVFKYDENSDQFIFGDSSKVILNEDIGNLLIFKNQTGDIEAEGKFNIGSQLKYLKVFAAGNAQTSFPPPPPSEDIIQLEDSTAFGPNSGPEVFRNPMNAQLMTGINLIVPEQLLKIMLNDFKASSFDAQNIVYLTDMNFYRKATLELFGKNKDMDEIVGAIGSGFLDIPKKFNPFTLLFSQLKLKWDADYQSFVTTSNKSGLISIEGESIGKMITSYIEFKMPPNGDDRMYIYLKSPSELYYYFGFKQGILSIVSNNSRFMEEFEKLKPKDLIMKMDDGEPYEIQPVEPGRATLFLRRIQAANNK